MTLGVHQPVCVCVCVCVYLYVDIYMCVFSSQVALGISVPESQWQSLCVCVCVCVFVRIYMCVYVL